MDLVLLVSGRYPNLAKPIPRSIYLHKSCVIPYYNHSCDPLIHKNIMFNGSLGLYYNENLSLFIRGQEGLCPTPKYSTIGSLSPEGLRA